MKTSLGAVSAATAATKVAGNGTIERVEFRGPEGERIYSFTYEPVQQPRSAVLICPSLHGEFTRNYRREVLLARRLAGEGFAVERFHYRGTGNSDGEGLDVTFDTMRKDATVSLEHLRGWSGIKAPVLLGTRWGALLAASTAATDPSAALVLWEPLSDVSRFFRDALRSNLIHQRKSGAEQQPTGKELTQRLRAGEPVDLIGYTIYPGLYESSIGRTIEAELGPIPRSVLILQLASFGTIRPDIAELAERWRAAGFHVEIHTIDKAETWWLVEERGTGEKQREITNRLIELTSRWIDARDADRRSR